MPFNTRAAGSSALATRRAAWLGAAALGWFGLGALPLSARANALQVGQSAPPATLVALDGKHWNTEDLRGQVIILTFWATWCEPCREELPLLSAYASQHAAEGLTVLAISVDSLDQLEPVRAIARTLKFPVGLLATSNAAGYGRMWRLPVSFTIGRDGRLVDNGWKDSRPVWTQERLERIVAPLLSEAYPHKQESAAPISGQGQDRIGHRD